MSDFDISKHEFIDPDLSFDLDKTDSSEVWFGVDTAYSYDPTFIFFDKEDAIAIAKHFKLTAEDLD